MAMGGENMEKEWMGRKIKGKVGIKGDKWEKKMEQRGEKIRRKSKW